MGTEKRDRQRAARLEKQAAMAKTARRQRLLKRGGIIILVAAVVVGFVLWTQGGNSKTPATTSPTSTTSSMSSTTSTTSSGSATKVAQAKADAMAVAAGCPKATSDKANSQSYPSAPAMTIDKTKTYTAAVKTTAGDFTIKLDAAKAPETVNSFVFLASKDYYHCVIFHRVIPGFMDQTGDPTGTGTGGPGYTIPDENPAKASPQYPIGAVAMANTGSPHSGGSQFFIVTGAQGESLPNTYALFGQVTSGMTVVQAINKDGSAQGVPPTVTHRILSVTVTSN